MLIGAGADVREDIRVLTSQLGIIKQRVPVVAAKAINEILKTSAPAVIAEMQRVFDRPTPWTLKSYRVLKWAGPRSLYGDVGFKDLKWGDASQFAGIAGVYLQPEIQGIPRGAKGLENALRGIGMIGPGEFLVPSRFMKLDRYGNVPRGEYNKIRANLRTSRVDPASHTPSHGARGGKKKAEYFWHRRGGGSYSRLGNQMTAIWKRISNGRAVPAFIVIGSAPKYRKVFEPGRVVQREVDKRFIAEFTRWHNALYGGV